MQKQSIRAEAKASAAKQAYAGVSPKRALRLIIVEIAGLREWMSVDPETPMRAEAAARLRELADILDLQR